MDVQVYKRRLVDLENKLAGRAGADALRGREQTIDSAADAGDVSVANEAASEDFTEPALNATVLHTRCGTRCTESTRARMAAASSMVERSERNVWMSWAAYCINHQKLLEGASRPTPPTL